MPLLHAWKLEKYFIPIFTSYATLVAPCYNQGKLQVRGTIFAFLLFRH